MRKRGTERESEVTSEREREMETDSQKPERETETEFAAWVFDSFRLKCLLWNVGS